MPALPRPSNGPGSRYTARAATTRSRPASAGRRTDIVALTGRLTVRDLWLIRMLHEHRVLTATHIAHLAFTGLRSAQRRLRTLHQLGVVDSFRPLHQTGSAPEHYTLGPAGAALLAAHAGLDVAVTGWRPTSTGRIAYSPSLGHDLGVNDFLVRLTARTHTAPSAGVQVWLSEQSCARRWGDIIRPDAYAHWCEGDRVLPFFLEYDTGSQTLARVEAKLAGYAAFTTTTGTRPALLLLTRTQSRDLALRRRLANTAHELNLHIATSSLDFTTDTPWARWWTPLAPGAHRSTLTELAGVWPDLTEATGLEVTDADTVLTLPVPPLPPSPASGP
ncbi:replication-relaxation family protein [Streptomyces sp. TRM66268-LWL]|uniref:Replication-relaxation family protein n=1 Tax=Streptomyces polyasparticus TaxID=2767826 RepID=A0ABR7SXM6_9ACTN|nr:replication-relaxation family protein [Streptomyces polyasparticus]MBC9719382.1 replication-relaxation family protein [Streptomyces polyasparticus]